VAALFPHKVQMNDEDIDPPVSFRRQASATAWTPSTARPDAQRSRETKIESLTVGPLR
jgi:hypothetical protein